MSNPDNAIGTNAAYSGRTSVNAFNDGLAAYSRGILSGWNCQPDTGLTVVLGGSASVRDVAIAEDNAGNKTTINNISADEVPVTLGTAPGANSRIDAIVAYVDNPPQGNSTDADNPSACGIIAVAGTPAVTPVVPNESAIRSAITADGASGSTAYYVVLAQVTVASGTTDLTAGDITAGDKANTVTADMLDLSGLEDFAGAPVVTATLSLGYGMNAGLTRIGNLVILNGTPINTQQVGSGETTLTETCPSGYRPTGNRYVPGVVTTNPGGTCGWQIQPGGTMVIFVPSTITTPNRIMVSAVWLTNDSWPSA